MAVAPTQVDEWTPLIIAKLKRDMVNDDDSLKRFIALLKETGAVVAGGYLLQAIAGYDDYVDSNFYNTGRSMLIEEQRKRDMDIFVPGKKMKYFLEEMVEISKLNLTGYSITNSTIYCRSFLRRNGIRRIYRFGGKYLNIDVMALRNRRTPIQVCSTFDLTCCQVWFDGSDVFATHPDHIREKKAWLQGDYIPLFIKGNNFLRERMAKYQGRGFTIKYEPSFTIESLQPLELVALEDLSTCPKEERDEAFMERWFKRVSLKWLAMTEKDVIHGVPVGDPFNGKIEDGQIVPKIIGRHSVSVFAVEPDEGYDSEDVDDPTLSKIALEKWLPIVTLGIMKIPEEKWKEFGPTPLDATNQEHLDFIKSRCLFALLYKAYDPDAEVLVSWMDTTKQLIEHYEEQIKIERDQDIDEDWIKIITKQLEGSKKRLAAHEKYLAYLKSHCGRQVDSDFFGDDGLAYDFHGHPMGACVTQASLESYIIHNNFKDLPDKKNGIPCYYKPNAGVPDSPENCRLPITLNEIRAIVSDEFYKKFIAEPPLKTGLNTHIPGYDLALPNVKTDEPGYGEEYHESMCPFCLQPVSRGSGCSYMTHDNPGRLPYEQTPFCSSLFVVNEVRDKYVAFAKRIQPDIPLHLEFCIECGRPCLGHQHFDLSAPNDAPSLVAPLVRTAADGRVFHDYAACPGGGRPELFARMLAVRDVYADSGIMDPKEERQIAAIAADAAAKDNSPGGYLERGRKIFAQDEAVRRFNRNVPATKNYNHPAYRKEGKESDEWDDGDEGDSGYGDEGHSENGDEGENGDDGVAADGKDDELGNLGVAVHPGAVPDVPVNAPNQNQAGGRRRRTRSKRHKRRATVKQA